MAETPPDQYPTRVFEGITGPWHGIVIDFIPHHESHSPTIFNVIEVLLSSHGGSQVKTHLTDGEIKQYIEIINET